MWSFCRELKTGFTKITYVVSVCKKPMMKMSTIKSIIVYYIWNAGIKCGKIPCEISRIGKLTTIP